LSIRLPHLYAPAAALENRHHSLRPCRYAGQAVSLRGGCQPPLSLYSAEFRRKLMLYPPELPTGPHLQSLHRRTAART